MITARWSLLPHLLSVLRPLIGAGIVAALAPSEESALVLPLVLLACASDWLDGEVARRLGSQTRAGRLVDNLCDFFFLLFLFEYFALCRLWSPPVWGTLIRYGAAANQLPVMALVASFGSYFVRLGLEIRAGRDPARSRRGHAAGVCNYVLVVAGGVELLPGVRLGPWLLEPAMLAVVLLNLSAVFENLALMFHRESAGPRMSA